MDLEDLPEALRADILSRSGKNAPPLKPVLTAREVAELVNRFYEPAFGDEEFEDPEELPPDSGLMMAQTALEFAVRTAGVLRDPALLPSIRRVVRVLDTCGTDFLAFAVNDGLRSVLGAVNEWDRNLEALVKHQNPQVRNAVASGLLPFDSRALATLNNLGLLRQEQGNSDGSIQAFRDAIARRSDYTPAYLNLGSVLSKAGRSQEAIEVLERAIAKDPQNKKAHLELGVVYARGGRPKDAERVYRALIQNEPRYLAAVYNLGLVLESSGQTESAKEQFRQAVELDPEHVKSWRHLAMAAAALSDWDGAREAAVEVLERESGDRVARVLLARAHAASGRINECKTTLELGLKESPEDPELTAAMSQCGE